MAKSQSVPDNKYSVRDGTGKNTAIVLVGPTASGKSAMALAAARKFDGTVINADSMQVYKDLSIVTARPTAEEEAEAPHMLYGILDGGEVCSAARWRNLAEEALSICEAQSRLPIFCGGTGFYIKALLEGLSPMPEVSPDVRTEVRAGLERLGSAGLHAWLGQEDPVMAARLNPSDGQRIARALEVKRSTGRSLADWQDEPLSGPPAGWSFLTVALLPPREWLRDRINVRFRQMIDQGAMKEVEKLLAKGLPPDCPVMRAVGVPELANAIKGVWSLDEAVERASAASRQYAKRQYTWIRNQIIANLTIKEQFSEKTYGDFFAFICENGLTT